MENKTVAKAPFQQLLYYIFIGMLMTFLNIKVMKLNYILPIVGLLILLASFRLLKNENIYFKYALYTVFIGLLLRCINYMIDATILKSLYPDQFFYTDIVVSALMSILTIVYLLSLKKSLMVVQEKAGTNFKLKSINYMIIYIVLSSVVAIVFIKLLSSNSKIASPLDFLGIVFIGLIIVVTIWVKFHKDLKNCYALDEFVTIVQPKYANKMLTIMIVLSFVILIVLANIAMSSYSMNWVEAQHNEDAALIQIKSELVALGFPKDVIEDISSNDIIDCKGAIGINLEKISDVNETFSMLEDAGEEDAKNELENKLTMFGILVELPSEKKGFSKYKIFKCFKWDKPKEFSGTQCLFIVKPKKIFVDSASDYDEENLDITSYNTSNPSGKLFYSQTNKTYQADFYDITAVDFAEDDIYHIREREHNGDYVGSFSLPSKADSASGYMAYTLEIEKIPFEIDGGYSYKNSLFQYPTLTAKDDYLKNPSGICKYNGLYIRNVVGE